MIQLSELNYDVSEQLAVKRVLDSGWLTMGSEVASFEREFSKHFVENQSCLAVSSCTAALHLAMKLCGVGEGDEVVISGLTFVAAANMALSLGSTPIFMDVRDLNHWNSGLENLKAVVTDRTKAVIITHFAGHGSEEVESISNFCKAHGIYLIEDCAHSPGAKINSKLCGTFGDMSCFSFFSNKNIATGEGGMLSLKDENLLPLARSLRSHGMSTMTFERHKGRAHSYDVTAYGFNYRMDEIRGALGLCQIKKQAKDRKLRHSLVTHYLHCLSDTEVKVPFVSEPLSEPVHHIMPVLLPNGTNRPNVMQSLRKWCQTSIHYLP